MLKITQLEGMLKTVSYRWLPWWDLSLGERMSSSFEALGSMAGGSPLNLESSKPVELILRSPNRAPLEEFWVSLW